MLHLMLFRSELQWLPLLMENAMKMCFRLPVLPGQFGSNLLLISILAALSRNGFSFNKEPSKIQDIRESKLFSLTANDLIFFGCIDSILISSHLHSSAIHYWYYDFLKIIFLVNLFNQEWFGKLGGKLTKREAVREVLKPGDELPISQMCPNVVQTLYFNLGRAFTPAYKSVSPGDETFISMSMRRRQQTADAKRCTDFSGELRREEAVLLSCLPPLFLLALLLTDTATNGSIAGTSFVKGLLPSC